MSHQNAESLVDAGLASLRGGDAPKAEASFRAALALAPGHAEALSFLGVSLHQQGNFQAAREVLAKAIACDDASPDAHYNLAEVHSGLGEKSLARESYLACLRLDPQHLFASRRYAELCAAEGDFQIAALAANEVLRRTPSDGRLALWTGQLFLNAKLVDNAIECFTQAANLLPENLEAHQLLCRCLASTGKIEKALDIAEKAVKIAPEDQETLKYRLRLLCTARHDADAVKAGEDFARRFPEDPDGHSLLGDSLFRTKELGAAALALAQSIKLQSDKAVGYAKLGAVLMHIGHLTDAEVQLQEAIKLDPKLVAPRVHLSVVLERMPHRTEEAIEAALSAVEVDPKDTEALNWLGMLLIRNGRHSKAMESFQQSLEALPDNIGALTGYGILLAGCGQIEQAWQKFERAMEVAPNDPYSIMSAVFYSNAHPGLDKDQIFVFHQRWAAIHQKNAPAPFTTWDNDRRTDRPLRVGYLSPDLRAHSVAYFFEPLLTAHDRSRVQAFVFDNTLAADTVTMRLNDLADGWFRIVGAGDDRVLEIIRQQRIDILVDLAGHTAEHRLSVFARKPAPLQISYLGYPNTTGLAEMDYRFTDDLADPPGADTYYTEQLIRLPQGFLCFQYARNNVDVGPLPAVQTGTITFASFNAVHKINQHVIALWARVLEATPDSRLLLKAAGYADSQTREFMIESFAKHRIDRDRIVFAARTPSYDDHIALYNTCDIALDTFPYNGTTTTCEAMWMGVPVVTLAGDRHSARVGLSILSRLDMLDFIAHSPEEFVAIATKLAADRNRLVHLRSTLRTRMSQSQLMNSKAHANAIENAYHQIWQEWCVKHPVK
jgi:protein O-GlcNAc transferase